MKKNDARGIADLYGPEEYYTHFDIKSFSPGQFCWLPAPYLTEIPRILDIKRDDPRDHDTAAFSIRDANRPGDFEKKDRSLPLYYLKLKAGEELVLHRAKKRPGLIISSCIDKFPEITELLPSKGKKHLQSDCIFIVPCYGIETEYDRQGFFSEMVTRIQYMMYRQFFYIPGHAHISESILRLDRIQIVIGRGPHSIRARDFGLSPELFGLLLSQMKFMITGTLDKNLEEIRNLLLAEYKSER